MDKQLQNPDSQQKTNRYRKKWKRLVSLVSCLVIFCTTYSLILPALTLNAKETFCHKEEHIHSEECYQLITSESNSTLELSDASEEPAEEASQEDKSDSVVQEVMEPVTERVLICQKEEHQHERICESNPDDIETEEQISRSIPTDLSSDVNTKVLQISQSQVGYQPKEKNFILAEKDEKHWNRYGALYSDPYESMKQYFSRWVLSKAGLNSDWLESSGGISSRIRSFDQEKEYPEGSVVFFKNEDQIENGFLKQFNKNSSELTVVEATDKAIQETIIELSRITGIVSELSPSTDEETDGSLGANAPPENSDSVLNESNMELEEEGIATLADSASKISISPGNTYELTMDSVYSVELKNVSPDSQYYYRWRSEDSNLFTVSNTNYLYGKIPDISVQTMSNSGAAKLVLECWRGSKWESFETFTFIISEPEVRRLNFHLNGGSGTTPESIVLETGKTVQLPVPDATKDNHQFVGWSTHNNYTEAKVKDIRDKKMVLHPAGSEYEITSAEKSITLYAAWAEMGSKVEANFFIRLSNDIPYEPSSYEASGYTGSNEKPGNGMSKIGALKHKVFAFNSENGIGYDPENGPLLWQPDLKDVANAVYAKRNDSNNSQNYTVKYVNGQLYKASKSNGTLIDKNGQEIEDSEAEAKGVMVEVRWYVIKKEDESWHVDGILVPKDRLQLIYDPNCNDPIPNTTPYGSMLNKGSTVYVSYSQNNRKNPAIHTERAGYEFVEWNTKSDGTGTSYKGDGSDTFIITEDTTLYAIWTRGTNLLTVSKTDMNGVALKGAEFKLDKKEEADSDWTPISQDLTTNSNGIFTFSNLENITLYRLTETYAPNGFETRNSFYFKVSVEDATNNLLEFKVCDQSGNPLGDDQIPEWIKPTYSQSGKTLKINLNIKDETTQRKTIIRKVDENGRSLSGSEFTLTRIDDNKDFSDLLQESNDQGIVSKSDTALEYGTYVMQESKVPEGYYLSSDLKFEVNDIPSKIVPRSEPYKYSDTEDIGIKILEGSQDLDIELYCSTTTQTNEFGDSITETNYEYRFVIRNNRLPYLKLRKTDMSKHPLANAEFLLESSNDEEFTKRIQSDDDGMIEFGYIPNGNYVLKETVAPAGYLLLDTTISIRVENGQLTVLNQDFNNLKQEGNQYLITVTNTEGKKLPETGGTGTGLYSFSGILLLIGSVVLAIFRRIKLQDSNQ